MKISVKMRLLVVLVSICLVTEMSAMSLLDVNCPESCDCSQVSQPIDDQLQITCFIWDLHDFDFQSLLLLTGSYQLTLYCESEVPTELSRGMFSFLNQMTSISLNSCKLSYVNDDVFQDLDRLHKVSIHSASNLNLRIHPDAFKSLTRLDYLSLVDNGLRKIPNLCSFKSLKSVNLSGNALRDLRDCGIACNGQDTMESLTLLDLSDNRIRDISGLENYGQKFPNLEAIVLENNDIFLKEQSKPFINFPNLRILDLSGNALSFISEDLVEKNSQLQEFDLSHNQITSISEHLLKHSKFLLRFGISHNYLNDTFWPTLRPAKKLMYLDLSHNWITSINSSLIEDLTELMYLDIGHNQLFSLSPQTFQNQQRLQTLILGGNEFHTLDNDAFYGLFMLSKLELQGNKLYSINPDIFASLTTLIHLNLSSNYLIDLPNMTKLTSLIAFDASDNILGELDDTTFQGQKNVRDIILSNNKIPRITEILFKPCDMLENLDLSVNAIEYVHPSMFMDLAVQRLLLQENKIEDIGKTFASMKHLRELNLSHNSIRDIIQRYMFPGTLEMLDLSHNNIQHVRKRAFYGLSEIRMVDIGYNKIETLPEEFMLVSNGPYSQSAFVIKGNPLICDCNLLWLRNWVQTLKGPMIVGLNETICSGAYEFPDSAIYLVPTDSFLCQYDEICTKKCVCCAYKYCACKYECPNKCECYKGAESLNIHYIQCADRNITEINKAFPNTATRLDLSGNSILQVNRHAFISMNQLKVLYLNHSSIQRLANRSFVGLSELTSLYLQYNLITILQTSVFEGLDSVVELHLDHNQISLIKPGVFDKLTNLKTVRLSHNYLQFMDDYTSHLLFKFRDITMYSNPWQCDCAMYFSAKHNPAAFVSSSNVMMANSVRINCTVHSLNSVSKLIPLDEYRTICEGIDLDRVSNDQHFEDLVADSAKVPYKTSEGERNSSKRVDQKSDTIQSEILGLEIPETHLKVFIPVIVGSCIIVLLVLFVLFKTGLARCWLCARYSCRPSEDHILYDKTRHYDAFIAYHPQDDTFVIRELALRLERGHPKYQLLVQHRDFPIGSSMPHFIENAVRYSHRTILVLSSAHIYDHTWLKYVVDCVKQDSLRRLIVVRLGKIDKEVLDPVVKTRIKSEYSLKHNERWFWQKMKFFLPKPGKTESDNARAEVRPYASTDLGRLTTIVRDNQAYEEPVSTLTTNMSSRPLPTITEYVTSSTSSYVYSTNSQNSSNIYEEIPANETSPKILASYEEPWKDSDLDEKFSTISRESTRPLCSL